MDSLEVHLDTQHNDTQNNDIQHNDSLHRELNFDIKYKNTQLSIKCLVSLCLGHYVEYCSLYCYTYCHYAKCRYDECRYPEPLGMPHRDW
jgi:hypothetical protein